MALVLLLLTTVSGLVDATSFLVLGHVFVANMTGNVAFLGFASAGATEFSAAASLTAIVSFMAGALLVGRLLLRRISAPLRRLRATSAGQLVLLLGALTFALLLGVPRGPPQTYVLIVLLALAMGVQSAAAYYLAVPGLSRTTVLTTTLTGLAAGTPRSGDGASESVRLALSVGVLLGGAFIGAVLVLRVGVGAPLGVATALVGLAVLTAHHAEVHRGDSVRR